ncbi:large conductance mechanosensitive channel protein MscL [Pontibacillus sp. HMF3514]|uniref:large conductance mechanosensitive channel protein MscL n=1 Tax=Pontibacillus sp. HMF3514 TaxID=2692425 RepID=UPI0013201A75|nr:large conductance mechanosensitive channel protein MscL [Pontibacillus sp. HMF3514]QHE52067.1 large conductance mechanosensitive channel protein MscL [Pontibacillus sp. HMF3514]
MWKEFKAFAIKGNVFDLAIAVIIGAAFSKIVDSLVNDIIMPSAGLLIGGVNLKDLSFSIHEVTIQYGAFLQTMVDFFIIAFGIFMFLKVIFKLRGKSKSYQFQEETTDQILSEIRDIVKDSHQIRYQNADKRPEIKLKVK